IRQGGSTITQQAAKNLFLTPDRTFKRKIQEVLLALWLEHSFTKDQILTVYLNRVYFGAGAYGIDAAARRHFGVAAKQLTLYQAALIAGLLKAPTRLNPAVNPEGAKMRAHVVLGNMIAAGYLSQKTMKHEVTRPLRFVSVPQGQQMGRYFTDWIGERLTDLIGPVVGGVTVRTTLDTRLQGIAETELSKHLAAGGRAGSIGNGAVVVMSPSGAVRALVGGKSYAESQFNRATQALRQPGSAFKPIVYLAGLRAGLSPRTRLTDAPIEINGWKPRNYDGKYHGSMTLAEALSRSINTIAVKVSEKAGRAHVIKAARQLGLTTKLPAHPSLALGAGEVTPLELTAAYASFANGGRGVWAHGISDISDAKGNLIYRRQGGGPGRVVSESNAAAISQMLAGVIQHGTGTAAAIGRPAAGKTGTSQDFRDAWFVGYSADLVAGVWLGNDNNQPMKHVTGGGAPARLWRDVMVRAHAGMPLRPLAGPENLNAPSSLWQRVVDQFGGGKKP
ncbi:MAG: PBP1A family penicillin-binding protein, partial [Rhodospirillales bacterium]|nr:PBP1A family penicillin-binding protein [Rhodospirillales bacterium]